MMTQDVCLLTVTYLLFLAEYWIISAVFWIFGAASGINFFTIHSPLVLFLYLFICNVLIAFSMLLTVFFAKTRLPAVGFILIFALVIGGYMVFETLQSDPSTLIPYYAWQWLPTAFMRATVFIRMQAHGVCHHNGELARNAASRNLWVAFFGVDRLPWTDVLPGENSPHWVWCGPIHASAEEHCR